MYRYASAVSSSAAEVHPSKTLFDEPIGGFGGGWLFWWVFVYFLRHVEKT